MTSGRGAYVQLSPIISLWHQTLVGFCLSVPVLWLDVVRHRLGLFVTVVMMAMVMRVVCWANVVHSVDTATFVATLERSATR